jgi:hypothetical protein
VKPTRSASASAWFPPASVRHAPACTPVGAGLSPPPACHRISGQQTQPVSARTVLAANCASRCTLQCSCSAANLHPPLHTWGRLPKPRQPTSGDEYTQPHWPSCAVLACTRTTWSWWTRSWAPSSEWRPRAAIWLGELRKLICGGKIGICGGQNFGGTCSLVNQNFSAVLYWATPAGRQVLYTTELPLPVKPSHSNTSLSSAPELSRSSATSSASERTAALPSEASAAVVLTTLSSAVRKNALALPRVVSQPLFTASGHSDIKLWTPDSRESAACGAYVISQQRG